MKLTRKQIREGLNTVPIDTVLLGASSPVDSLTPKQREFARLVALGESKTGAYRKAYDSKGKRETAAVHGCTLSKQDNVARMIEAYQLANEAAKYRTPAQLRDLVIHQLTQHALDANVNPAQRIKALELLGKVSEVAAFTERKETTVINQSSEIRAKLLEHLKNVVDVDAREPSDDTDTLLAEIEQGKRGELLQSETLDPHPPGTPLSDESDGVYSLHTTPHKQIQPHSDPHKQIHPEAIPNAESADPSTQEDPPLSFENEQGEGVYFSEIDDENPKDK